MTRTREENTMDMLHEEKLREALERELEDQPNLVEALGHIQEIGICDDDDVYQQWLQDTGLDDSFVGGPLGDTLVPGTLQLFEAAVAKREHDLEHGAGAQPGL